MDKKRIAFFLGSMGRGGAERVISVLSKEYAAVGWDTDICVLLSNEIGYEIDSSTQFHDFTGKGSSRIKKAPYWILTIRRFIKEQNPDVIVSFAARINVLVMLACIGLGKKIVISERNDPKFDGRGIPTKLMTKILYPHANCIVFQTRRVWSYFSKPIRKKGVVIPNPISVTQKADNFPRNKIVTVGRLDIQKNQKMLIDAFSDLSKEFIDMELYIYGEGDLREKLEEQVVSLSIEKKVHFEGNIYNIHEKISDALFFVLPSDYEGLSNALLEAMMMGLPCISTDCAGSDEYIVNEKSGLLVPVGDQNALTQAMRKFVLDSELREKCKKGALEASKEFQVDYVMKQWNDVIR